MTGLRITADENIPNVQSLFAPLGEVTTVDGRQLCAAQLRHCDILLVRSVTAVNRALLEGSKVRFVATATIGIDHLDTDYLDSAGIEWAAAPGCNADSVVDYVLSAFCRLDGVLSQLLAGATVGIVGMGNVGSRLYRRLSKLGIRCVGYDPLIAQNTFPVLTDLDTVLSAEVVCLHAPLTRSGPHPSYHLIDERRLQQLNLGTVLINAGRGAVVDNSTLKNVLAQRADLCVVLDVWENEPAIDIELLKRIDLATPHIAGYSLDGKMAGAEMIYRACCQFLQLPANVAHDDYQQAISIDTRGHFTPAAAIREAVLTSYDIGKDDQRLRGALLSGVGRDKQADQGLAFDKLRKDYPVRREFSRYRISNVDALDHTTINSLQALGFSS